jgi:hypothetical protein
VSCGHFNFVALEFHRHKSRLAVNQLHPKLRKSSSNAIDHESELAMAWTWIYQNEDGSPSPSLPAEAVVTPFPTQADAEAFIGQTWEELLAGGVEAVTLYDEDREVYGPMSLKPAE